MQTGVPFGPCGYSGTSKVPGSTPEYQNKVLSVNSPHCIIFEGPPARQCNRKFCGEDCYTHHLIASEIKYSVCDTTKKCPHCCKQARKAKKKPTHGGDRKSRKSWHRCGFAKCGNCGKITEVASHKCFIQPVNPKEDEPRMKGWKNA